MRPQLGDPSAFGVLASKAYLNHAAIAAPSAWVRDALDAYVRDMSAHGFGAFGRVLAQRESVRGKLAKLIGADADEVGLVQSTTAGLLALALCIPFRAGDRVVLFEGEFPANVTPWQRAAERFGLELVWVPVSAFERSEDEGLALLRAALGKPTRLVAVSLVQFQTGFRMPVARIAAEARAAGAEVSVDAVQAAGIVPFDVRELGVDYLACGSHKWLMGLDGAGFVWVARERWDALSPTYAGWLSHEEPVRFLVEGAGLLRYDRTLRKRPDFLEVGNLSSASLAALDASVGALLEVGVASAYDHVQALHDVLEPRLAEAGLRSKRSPRAEARSGSLSFEPPPNVPLPALAKAIAERGVSVSTPDGHLRLSPHFWTPREHAELGATAIVDAMASLLR